MPGCKKVLDYEMQTAKATATIDKTEWLFCLDFNTINKTRKMADKLTSLTYTKILINHHQKPQVEMFDYSISDTSKSSTSEMVYDFITDSGNTGKINENIAEYLYTDVMTDTGSFRFTSTTTSVHIMIAELKKQRLKHSKMHENLFDNFLENRIRFFGHILLNQMEIFYEYNTTLIAIPQSDLIKYNVKTKNTKNLVNFPLSIHGIKLASVIIDKNNERKSSFRSKEGFDVNTFARKYFNKNGHFNTAGSKNSESLDKIVRKFKVTIRENKEQLSSYQF